MPGLVLQAVRSPIARQVTENTEPGEVPFRVGFTASRRVGGAIQRNRAKRRLRAVVADVMPGQAAASRDFVLIGRKATLRRSFADLKQDLLKALRQTKSLAAADARAAS